LVQNDVTIQFLELLFPFCICFVEQTVHSLWHFEIQKSIKSCFRNQFNKNQTNFWDFKFGCSPDLIILIGTLHCCRCHEKFHLWQKLVI